MARNDRVIHYDVIVPEIAPSSICHEIFVRAYAEPKLRRHRYATVWASQTRPESWFDGEFMVIDTETVHHKLTFGVFYRYRRRKLIERGVFYEDSLPKTNPVGFARLRTICRKLSVPLCSLASLFSSHIWRMRKRGGTLVFFNAGYDLSRLASSWRPASAKRKSRFLNGFEFVRSFTTSKDKRGIPLVGKDGTLQSRVAEPTFARIRRDDRHHVRYDMGAAKVLDLANLTHGLTDKTYTLQGACKAFGVEFADRPGEHDGTITEPNVRGCLYDVAKTSELLFAAGAEFDRHPIDLPPWQVQSGASLIKAYLRAFGVAPRLIVQPDFSKEHQGYAAVAYFGGRVEARIVATPVPCVYVDAVSMYPTVFTLLNLWFDQVIPARLVPEEIDPAEVQVLLDELHDDPRRLLDPATWPQLAFFALVEPNGAHLPSRPNIPSPYLASNGDNSAAAHRLVSIGPVHSNVLLWYAGPDLAAAAISNGGRPRIVRAWRLRPEGVQSTLKPVAFRGDERDLIDPRTVNPFQRLIELRKRQSGDELDDALRSSGYKVMAVSGAYGIFVETTPEDIDPDAARPLTPVDVWGLKQFTSRVDRPETHSPWCSFPIAALVTAGARLLLAVGQRLVHDAGGEVAYCDTDSLMIVASEHGGFAPCDGGTYRMRDGSRAVRALSWREVDQVLGDLASLNVYNRDIVKGSSFRLEDVNFDVEGGRQQLWFYGTREKSYALYALDDRSNPVIAKQSAHTIGQYSSPYPGDRERRWIAEAWEYTIRDALGMPVEAPAWFDLPATSQLTLTTRNVMKHYTKTSQPFDFLAVAQLAFPGLLRCCQAPRPSCPVYADRGRWAEQPWRCLSCGASINPYLADTEQSIFKTYRRVVANLTRSIELKRLVASGAEPTPATMRGLTIPRPVYVTSVKHIGKEVIVDPTDTAEELTAEQLYATDPVIYSDECEELDALRAEVRAIGVNAVARESGVSRSCVQAFVNKDAKPRPETIAKLGAAVAALRRRQER